MLLLSHMFQALTLSLLPLSGLSCCPKQLSSSLLAPCSLILGDHLLFPLVLLSCLFKSCVDFSLCMTSTKAALCSQLGMLLFAMPVLPFQNPHPANPCKQEDTSNPSIWIDERPGCSPQCKSQQLWVCCSLNSVLRADCVSYTIHPHPAGTGPELVSVW